MIFAFCSLHLCLNYSVFRCLIIKPGKETVLLFTIYKNGYEYLS